MNVKHKLLIGDENFKKLVNGEEITLFSRVNNDTVHLILQDIGTDRMFGHIYNAGIKAKNRDKVSKQWNEITKAHAENQNDT